MEADRKRNPKQENFINSTSYNNQETFIPDYSGTPTDLKPPFSGFQLALINKLQQAFKEQAQTKTITVQYICTIIINFSQNRII